MGLPREMREKLALTSFGTQLAQGRRRERSAPHVRRDEAAAHHFPA
jgi:hypothetical protein